MDRVKIDNFLGLYTNVDEAKLNPEYQSEAVNVRFRTGYIESEGYTSSEAVLPNEMIFCQSIRLDNDRYGTKKESDRLIYDYEQNFTTYLLTSDFRNKIYIDGELIGTIESPITKIIESDGSIKLLTKSGALYHLTNISRVFKGEAEKTIISFYLTKCFNYNEELTVNVKELFGQIDPIIIYRVGRFKLITTRFHEVDPTALYYDVQFRDSDLNPYGDPVTFLAYQREMPDGSIQDFFNVGLFANYPIYDGRTWDEVAPDGYINVNDFFLIDLIYGVTFSEPNLITGIDYWAVAVSVILDDSNEYIIYSNEKVFPNDVSNLALRIDYALKEGFNKRITAIACYVKYRKLDDYEQAGYYNLTTGFDYQYNNFMIIGDSGNGFYLTQTAGTLYNPATYKPISKISDYVEIEGVAYSVYQNRVYFSSVGKGKIMKEVFYDYIPEAKGAYLIEVNGSLGVFDSQLQIISIVDSKEGYLLFAMKDKMNFTVRDYNDAASSPEGIIIHTKRGIYVTNGYERKLISEQINDIVEKNFSTGNIFYLATDDILFYSYVDSKENYHTFKFDFVYGNWSEVKDGISGKLTFSEDGIIHYLNEERGKVYKLDKTNNVYSVIRTPNVDLDYPFLGKNLIYIDVDFEGELNYENYKVTHTKRMTARLGVPVSKRIPNALIGARFIFKGKIYTIDIYYDAIGEFRHENHIPSPETISEGIQQYPDYLESITK